MRLRPGHSYALTVGWEAGEVRVALEHLALGHAICYEVVHARRTGRLGSPFAHLLRE
jgi:hypothetical protein